jgi:hypothetical protein
MNLYGLLITKDDHEVFGDWCRDQLSLYDAVVCLDGSEGEGTRRIAAAFGDRLAYLHERDFVIPSKSDHGLRRVAHREIVRRFGVDNWVMCCHADEFCYHDPRKAAALAGEGGHDTVAWFSPHFLPHPDDLPDWHSLSALPVYERFHHYHWGYRGSGLPWVEYRLYKNGPRASWDRGTHGSTRPHGLESPAPFHPILRHFKVFTTDLGWYEDGGANTLYRGHWQGLGHRTGLPFPVRRAEDLFVRSYLNYDHCDYFEGTFSQPWNMGEQFRVGGAQRVDDSVQAGRRRCQG